MRPACLSAYDQGVHTGASNANWMQRERLLPLNGRAVNCDTSALFGIIGKGTFSQIFGLFLYFIGIKLFYSFDVGE